MEALPNLQTQLQTLRRIRTRRTAFLSEVLATPLGSILFGAISPPSVAKTATEPVRVPVC
jgi:hypothetical protein